MFLNLMGKRLQYDKRFTNEVRQSVYHREEFFYWQDVLKKYFPCVDVTSWGVKLPFSVDAKFGSLNNISDLVNLCKELYRIENGSKCVDDFDWYTIVKNELKELDDKAEQVQKDFEEWDARRKKETVGMTTKQIWDWIGNNSRIKHWSEGNEVKQTRKMAARLEEERRWEKKKEADRKRLIEWKENRKPKSEQKSKPKAVAKRKVKTVVKQKKEKEINLFGEG